MGRVGGVRGINMRSGFKLTHTVHAAVAISDLPARCDFQLTLNWTFNGPCLLS